jgi:hypothetical protein
MSVKPTTHGLRRCVASEIAPNKGIDSTTRSDEMLLATAAIVFDAPTSFTSHTAKNSVAMFIEKIVLEKSYNAQLHRSIAGARGAITSPSGVTTIPLLDECDIG